MHPDEAPRLTFRSRSTIAVLAAFAIVLVSAAPAFAHTEFQPDAAPAGSRTAFNLYLENEQSDAGTVEVQLFFPEAVPVVLAALPDAPGWTTTVAGGQVGEAVTNITWKRATAAPEDVLLPVTLDLPTNTDRLQFTALQTYSNGEVESWTQPWPAGAPEPDAPGPVLTVTGATATPTTSAAAPTTEPAPTTVPASTTTIGTTAPESSDDDSNNAALLAIGAAIVVLGGAGIAFFMRRRRA